MGDGPQPVIYQGDLRTVYLDPDRPPPKHDMLAYIPEQHASANCERALKGGTDKAKPNRRAPWCDMCTTPHKAAATRRRTLTGWKQVA